MIYFLHGTDTHKSRKRLHTILQGLLAKRPNSEVFKITADNFNESQIDELISSFGLFESKYIVVLDFILSQKNVKEIILDKLSKMQETEHWFLILDGKLDASSIKTVEKYSYKTEIFEKVEQKKDSPIIFKLTDKILQRDKKQLWISYVDLLEQGIPAEEIHGVMFWAVKNMIICSTAESQKDSGLSPFVYKNSLTGSRHFKIEELKKMSEGLVGMLHKVRTGNGEMEVMLEKWMLVI